MIQGVQAGISKGMGGVSASLGGGLTAMAGAGAGYGGGGAVVIQLQYSPMFSMADQEELRTRLQPVIEEGLRRTRGR